MSQSSKHAFTSPKADGGDSTLVKPSNWNADHAIGPISTNRAGSTLNAGDVTIQDLSNDDSVVTTTTVGSLRQVYVAAATITNGSTGLFYQPGFHATVAVQGAVSRGDFLRTSATAGKAESAGQIGLPQGAFGVAIASFAGPGAGTVVAALFSHTVSQTGLGRPARDNLVVSSTGANTVTVTADYLALVDTSNGVSPALAVNVSPALNVSGLNGLDTGAEASSTGYYVWVISNGTTVAGLLSLSATAPTMPTGYTYKLLVGAVRNDGSSNILPFKQVGNALMLDNPVKTGNDLPASTGVTESSSLASIVPAARVKSVFGKMSNTSGGNRDIKYDAVTFANSLADDNADAAFGLRLTANTTGAWSLPTLREAQTMYFQGSSTNGVNVYVSGFNFDW